MVGGAISSYKPVCSGVPQGSVLGPILFLIYINDIDCCIQSRILKFADDIKIFSSFDPSSDFETNRLEDDLSSLSRWSQDWLLSLNPVKCRFFHFGHGNELKQYFIANSAISNISSVSDLGIHISDDLKPSDHCLKVAGKGLALLCIIPGVRSTP